MKFVEFHCSEPSPQIFFQDFIDNFKNDIKEICEKIGMELTKDIFMEIIMKIYSQIKNERVRVEKLGIPLETIRLELTIIDNRKIQFLIRSLHENGRSIFENDTDCIRIDFPSN